LPLQVLDPDVGVRLEERRDLQVSEVLALSPGCERGREVFHGLGERRRGAALSE
jgi:hypothetical protein